MCWIWRRARPSCWWRIRHGLRARGRRFSGMVHALVVGHKTNSVFYTKTDPATGVTAVYKADTNTGAIRKLVDLPAKRNIVSVNANETLAAGTYIEGDATGKEYGAEYAGSGAPGWTRGQPRGQRGAGSALSAHDKGAMMETRLAARLPLVLFTIRLEPGPNGEKPGDDENPAALHRLGEPPAVFTHRSHAADVLPRRAMAEGGPHLDDPHRRDAQYADPQADDADEIAGHEFWGLDGETIWYDWQYPKGEDFFLAGYNLKTGQRTAYHLQRDEWSIHFNLTKDLSLFCGDGGDPGQVARARTENGSSFSIRS